MSPGKTKYTLSHKKAFSLIEVVLAMGHISDNHIDFSRFIGACAEVS